MTARSELRVGILIGGSGRRMGGPKQMLQVVDRYLIDFVVEASRSIGPPALIGAGRVPEHLQELERVTDADGSAGPLAGVLGALEADPHAAWLIVACDQPWVTAAALEWLVRQRKTEQTAVMPCDAERVQPFPGIYRPGFAKVAAEVGPQAAISTFAEDRRVATPRIPAPLSRAWSSVNTPEDLATLLNSRG